MSDSAIDLAPEVPQTKTKSFVQHAKLIGFLTLISRFFGLGREIVAGHYLGAELVASAFTFAFLAPNLFRKLFGEGALSAAFIPLYSQALKNKSTTEANDFAAAAVNLLIVMLIGITIICEAGVWAVLVFDHNPAIGLVAHIKAHLDHAAVRAADLRRGFLERNFTGASQVWRAGGGTDYLNACHITVLLIGAKIVGLNAHAATDVVKQTKLAYALAFTVLVAGVMQVMVLLPSLRKTGFHIKLVPHFWTPAVKKMLLLSLPVAMGAGVLQISVVLDKGIAMALMQAPDKNGNLVTQFEMFGHTIRYPMEEGAPRRLDLAQNLYQFPLGIFAIALATAIFPALSADAMDKDKTKFRNALRHGIEASLWEGLPASLGLALVAGPITRLVFQHGQIVPHQAELIARSTMIYAGAIWAFSLLQIINRAYYAIHDTTTPLVMSIVNILINLIVEIPLLWISSLGESAMAMGTLVSFIIQAIVMLLMLDKKIGGLELQKSVGTVAKMIFATAIMGGVCVAIKFSPLYPHGQSRSIWAMQLGLLMISGGGAYLLVCALTGVHMLQDLLPKRKRLPRAGQ